MAISEEKLDKIKEYWLSNSNKIIRIKDIKKSVWAYDNNNKVPWNLKIATALKNKLGMSYKWLKFRHPKTQFSENKRLYIEAALTQCILNSTGHDIIFIDEFQINIRK